MATSYHIVDAEYSHRPLGGFVSIREAFFARYNAADYIIASEDRKFRELKAEERTEYLKILHEQMGRSA